MKSSFIPSHNINYEILSHEIYKRDFDKTDGNLYEYGIVFARKSLAVGDYYVTWEYTTISHEGTLLNRSFFWGHYTENKYSALIDYHERLSNQYRLHLVQFKEED